MIKQLVFIVLLLFVSLPYCLGAEVVANKVKGPERQLSAKEVEADSAQKVVDLKNQEMSVTVSPITINTKSIVMAGSAIWRNQNGGDLESAKFSDLAGIAISLTDYRAINLGGQTDYSLGYDANGGQVLKITSRTYNSQGQVTSVITTSFSKGSTNKAAWNNLINQMAGCLTRLISNTPSGLPVRTDAVYVLHDLSKYYKA